MFTTDFKIDKKSDYLFFDQTNLGNFLKLSF